MSEEQKNLCGKQALTLVYWPNHDPLPMCSDHLSWAVRVAGALGLHLTTSKAELGATCEQIMHKEKGDGGEA